MKSKENFWIPAFAGMTRFGGLPFELAHVRFVHISPNLASPEGEGFPPSPDGDTKGNGELFLERWSNSVTL
jgi:hypothetical protein